MKFSVADRIFLLNLDTLPNTGSFLKMRVLRDFMNELQFKPEEIEKWEIKEETGKILWNAEKAKNIDVSVSETLLGMIIEARDKSENIPAGALPTLEKFDELKMWFEGEKAKEAEAKAKEEKADGKEAKK